MVFKEDEKENTYAICEGGVSFQIYLKTCARKYKRDSEHLNGGSCTSNINSLVAVMAFFNAVNLVDV